MGTFAGQELGELGVGTKKLLAGGEAVVGEEEAAVMFELEINERPE